MGDAAFRNEDLQARKVVTLSPLVKGLAGGLECRKEQQHVGCAPSTP
jgi:hypothetical protein